MLNKSLTNAITNVMMSPDYGFYTIDLKFIALDQSFEWKPIHVETVHLVQDFIYGFGDQLKVTFPIAMAEYAVLFEHYNNLTAVLTIKFLDANGMLVKGKPLLVKKYYPIFDNIKDPNKMMTDVLNRVTPTGNNLTVTLMEPALYHIRHMPIQALYHNTTMAGVMAHLAAAYQINDVYIQAPDNDHVYTHLVIPPYREFKDVFHTLQERYGVYMFGINNYFTQDKLYLWPPLDTDPKAPYYANIYQADDGAFAGSPSYYRKEKDGISIVINNSPNAQDYSVVASEDHGAGAQFIRSSVQTDGVIHQDENGLLTYNGDNVINVRLNKNRLTRPDVANTRYVHQTDNLFEIAATLARRQYLGMVVRWPQARPWLLQPGTAVRYYSDERGKVGKRTGQVSKVLYEFKRGDRSYVNTYTCLSYIQLRLDPHEQLLSSVS